MPRGHHVTGAFFADFSRRLQHKYDTEGLPHDLDITATELLTMRCACQSSSEDVVPHKDQNKNTPVT